MAVKRAYKMDTLNPGDLASITDECGVDVLVIDELGDVFKIPSGTLALVLEISSEDEAWGAGDMKVMIDHRIGRVWRHECLPLSHTAC